MSYYSENAFIGGQEWPLSRALHPIMQEIYDDDNDIDLRKFPECEDYLAIVGHSSLVSEPEYLEKQKWRGNQIEEKKRKLNIYRHYYYNQSNPLLFVKLFSMTFRFGGWFFLILSILINILFDHNQSLYELFFHTKLLLIILGCYMIGFTCKHIEPRMNHNNGATFNRQTGKVHIVEKDEEKIIDFKDFIPLTKKYYEQNGNPYYETVIRSHGDKIGSVTIINNGCFANGLIEYHFLKHFMDVTRPLPEVPEFECYRHLDPVTKAHDEKTGRDPYYWRRMTKEEFNRIDKASSARGYAILGKIAFIKRDFDPYQLPCCGVPVVGSDPN